MQNAILGIRTLNITQGNFSTYTHKGINALDLAGEDAGKDVWRAKNRWKCVNVLPYNTTGFANTCLFSPCDENGELVQVNTPSGIKSLTIALTHDNSIRVKVGDIYNGDDFIYMEGTKGNATGNHIHAEACFSFVNSKVKLTGSQYYNGSTWVLPNAVPLHEALFLLDGYNLVVNDGGYDWKTVSSIEHEGSEMEFVEGYQEIEFKGVKVHAYKLKAGQKLGLMSATVPNKENWQAVATIQNIDNSKIHYCKINANRFVMATGEHIGVEQSFENDFAPKQNAFIALWHAKDGDFGYCNADEYWLSKADVDFACSPDVVLMKDGQIVKRIANGVEKTRLTQRTQQSLLIVLKDGSIVLAVTEAITLNEVVDVLKNVARDIYAFDGGGSAQMVVNGETKQYTGRAISCVLTAYKDSLDEPQEEPDVPDVPSVEDELKEENTKLKQENDKLTEMNEELHNRIDVAISVLNGSLVLESEE